MTKVMTVVSKTIRNIVRAERLRRRFGPDDQCLFCGYSNPAALTRIDRRLLHNHHVVFKATDEELTVVLCLNHHAEVHEDLRREGVSMTRPATVPELVANALRALKTFLPKLGDACDRWAEMLEGFVVALEEHFPAWRDLTQATTNSTKDD